MEYTIFRANNQLDILNTQIQHIARNMQSGRMQYIIVPDKYSLSMEKEIMQSLSLSASLNFEVLTFARFANLLVDIDTDKILSSLGATMVVQMLLNKYKKELKCFNKTRANINLASVIFDSISQMKSCNISYADIQNRLGDISNKLLYNKLSDIALIMQKYEEYLGNEYIDSANRLGLCSERLSVTDKLKDIDVHFCHFDTMTTKGMDIIDRLVSVSHSVSVGVVCARFRQNNQYIYTDVMYQQLLDIAKHKAYTPNIVDCPSILGKEQEHIVNNIMANTYDVLPMKVKDILPFVAGNTETEVKFVAMDIASKIKRGARYLDVTLNCTDLQSYAPVIRKYFDDYNIPFWIDLPFRLQDSELIKFLDVSMSLLLNNFTQEDILIYSKNILSGLSISEQMLFERVVKKYGIEYDMLNSNISTSDPEYAEYLNIRDKLFNNLWALKDKVKQTTNISGYVDNLKQYLLDMSISQKLDDLAIQNREDEDLYNESINRQVYDKLIKCLDNLYKVMAEYDTTFDDFYKILFSGIETISISPLPMAIDCVYVGQNLQSVFNQTPYYYILGVSDGSFPAVVSDVGIISDMDISILKQNNINLSPTITQVNTQSMQNCVQNLILFTKELRLSFALEANEGQHTLSAPIISLCNIFSVDGEELSVQNVQDYLGDTGNFDGEENKLLYTWGNLHNAISSVIIESNKLDCSVNKKLLSTAVKVLRENGYDRLFEKLKNNSVFAPSTQITKNILKDKPHLSVTELERYFQCPYQHYIDYGLKLKENEKSDIDSIDNGNIIHAVLENFAYYLNKHPQSTEQQIKYIVEKIFDKVLSSPDFERFAKNNKNAFALKKLCIECVRACQVVSFQISNGDYRIKFVEKSFGDSDFVPVPEIAVLGQSIKIRGKVDRLDEYKGKYRIVDYKTSKNAGTFSLLELYLGKKIQLFYYLRAILDGLKQKGIDAHGGGVYYLPIHREYSDDVESDFYSGYKMQGITVAELDNIIATDHNISAESLESKVVDLTLSNKFAEGVISSKGNKLCTDIQLNKILDYSNKIAAQAIVEIMQGYIEPKPLDGVCQYCKYKNLCKINCLYNKKARKKDFKIDIKTFEDIE